MSSTPRVLSETFKREAVDRLPNWRAPPRRARHCCGADAASDDAGPCSCSAWWLTATPRMRARRGEQRVLQPMSKSVMAAGGEKRSLSENLTIAQWRRNVSL